LTGVATFALTACGPDSATVEAEVQQLVRSYITSTDIAASVNTLDQAPTVTSITGQGRIVRGRDAITVGAIEVHEHFSYSAARRI
jgi:capsule polysaccharide export protein KpsC/LpsZ